MFCLKIKTLSPFYLRFAYLDIPEYVADTIFIQNKLHVKFGKEFKKEGNPYIIIMCKIRKKDFDKFEKSLEELERRMLLTGHTDYIEKCEEVKSWFTKKK